MEKICTSKEQSAVLVELGIDPDSADMYYHAERNSKGNVYVGDVPRVKLLNNHFVFFSNDVPAWSLPALIKMLPTKICVKTGKHEGYFYSLEWKFWNDNSLAYAAGGGKCLEDVFSDHDDENAKDLVDTAFEMVCRVAGRGKLNAGIKDVPDK